MLSVIYSWETPPGEELLVAGGAKLAEDFGLSADSIFDTLLGNGKNPAHIQARTTKHRLTFWVQRPAGGVRSTRRGGGRKARALPRQFVFLGFERGNLGCPGNFAGMSRPAGGGGGCSKSLRKTKFCGHFRPLNKKNTCALAVFDTNLRNSMDIPILT